MMDHSRRVQDPLACWEEEDKPGDGGCESPALAAEPKPSFSLTPKLSVCAAEEALSITGHYWPSGASDQLRDCRAQLAVPSSWG